MSKEHATLKSKFKITKYEDKESHKDGKIKEVSEFERNLFLTAGITKLWNLVADIDTSGHFSNANVSIGVGDGIASAAAVQTTLQGSNTAFVGMDDGYPSVSGNEITFYSTFGDGVAAFDWKEYGIVNGADDTNVLLDRKVSDQGTKSSSAIWQFEVTLSIS